MHEKKPLVSLYSQYLFFFEKYNPASILLLLYFLGSIVQIYELFKIDIFYIRFFSITQLLSDGAILLLLLTFVVIIYNIFGFLLQIFGFWEKIIPEDNELTKLEYSIRAGIILIIPLSAMILFPIASTDFFKNHNFISVFVISLYILALNIYNKSSSMYQDYLQSDASAGTQKNIYSDLTFIALGLNFPTALLLILLIFRIISASFQNPDDFENYNKIKSLVVSDYKELNLSVEDCEILYFNDKYTFIEITNSINQEKFIVMYQTESAFFDKKVIILDDK